MELALHVNYMKEQGQIIMNMDFEIAHHNAVREEFGTRVIIIGCLFHLLQSVHKWLKKKGDTSLLEIEQRQELDEDI